MMLLAIYLAFLSVAFCDPEKDKIDKQDEIIDPLNSIRAKYCLPPIIYDKALADLAEITAKLCLFTGSDPSVREEDYRSALIANDQPLVFPLSTGETVAATFAQVATINVWENQEENWNCSTDTCLPGKLCDSLRQILWIDSLRIGCSRYLCDFNSPFPEGATPWSLLVCNYHLPGIYDGQRPFPFEYCKNCSLFVPTSMPTRAPTKAPTPPTPPPTNKPTAAPTAAPTREPTSAPTPPTRFPTMAPTVPPPTDAPTPFIPKPPVVETIDEDKDIVNPINQFRAKWCLPPVEYSKSLALVADYFAKRCSFNRSDLSERNVVYQAALNFNGKNIPDVLDTTENLAASIEQLPSTNPWEVQESNYNCPANTCAAGMKCDSYLNMVEQTALKVGCARYLCDNESPFPGGQRPWRLLICEFHAARIEGTRPFPATSCTNCSLTVPTMVPTARATPRPTSAPTRQPTEPPTPIPPPTVRPPPTTNFPTFPPTPPPPTFAPTPQPTGPPVAIFTLPPIVPTNSPAPTNRPTTSAPTAPIASDAPTTRPPTASRSPTAPVDTTPPGPTDPPTNAPTAAPVQRQFANVTWTFKNDQTRTPTEVAAFIRQVIRMTTRFFLRSNGVDTNFKRSDLVQETWTASIYAVDPDISIVGERDRLAAFLKAQSDSVEPSSVSTVNGYPQPEPGLNSFQIAGIILGVIAGVILLALLIVALYLYIKRKPSAAKEKEYDLL